MKKTIDSLKNMLSDTSGMLLESYDDATALLKDTVTRLFDVKDMTKDKLAGFVNDIIALAPVIEETGYRTKEISIGVSIPPNIIFHFEKFKDISKEDIDAVLKKNESKELLKIIVGTLVSADNFQKTLTLGSFRFAEIDIQVGLPPQVNIKLANTSSN